MTGRSARVLADGLAFPEGPVALPDGSVAVVEMAADRVTVVAPDGTRRHLACPGGPNGMALLAGSTGGTGRTDGADPPSVMVCVNGGLGFGTSEDGRVLPGLAQDPAARGGLVQLSLATGRISPLVPPGPDSPVSGPNDLVVGVPGTPSGTGVWFTDLGRRFASHQEHGGVWWCGWDGGVTSAAYPRFGRPNGIALSSDGTTLYVTESQSAELWAWEVLGPGRLGAARLVHRFPHPARLDGRTALPSGDLLVATLVIGQLTTLTPEGGVVTTTDVGDPFVTNVCLADPLGQEVLVTLGSTGRLLRMQTPAR